MIEEGEIASRVKQVGKNSRARFSGSGARADKVQECSVPWFDRESRKKKQIIKYSLPVSVCVCVFVRLFREPVLVGRSGFNEEEEKVLVSMLLS